MIGIFDSELIVSKLLYGTDNGKQNLWGLLGDSCQPKCLLCKLPRLLRSLDDPVYLARLEVAFHSANR